MMYAYILSFRLFFWVVARLQIITLGRPENGQIPVKDEL